MPLINKLNSLRGHLNSKCPALAVTPGAVVALDCMQSLATDAWDIAPKAAAVVAKPRKGILAAGILEERVVLIRVDNSTCLERHLCGGVWTSRLTA
jgi:hypothetical protein